jgi:hypothetical protein
MEEQLAPAHTLGRTFAALATPSRSAALAAAGADVTVNPNESEYWRLLSAIDGACSTTLPAPLDEVALVAGEPRMLDAQTDFLVACDVPVQLAQFVSGGAAVVSGSEPAGDPSFILVPPIEQHRVDHPLVVPEGYAFDFVLIAAPEGADVSIDDAPVEDLPGCARAGVTALEGAPSFDAIRCALSEPIVSSGPPLVVEAGVQRDGLHRVLSHQPAGVLLYGFDTFVSYGYAAGTELQSLD